MLKSWLWRLLDWPRTWSDELSFRWHTSDRGQIGFALMLLLPCAAFGFIASAAYKDHRERQVATERLRDLGCLAENIYHEARGEPLAGQVAVAEVVLNRVASEAFPDTVCEVVHERRFDALRRRYVSAFSWTELETLRRPRGSAWQRAREIATAVYDRREPPIVPVALYYHAARIDPGWAGEKQLVATIGNHIFYR
jgi:spore germination cell wall hydrolase CwlJ-like protein